MNHLPALEVINNARLKGRLGQIILLVGKAHQDKQLIIQQLSRDLLCKQSDQQACGFCNDCQMAANAEHPDLSIIQPDKPQGGLKIDQIRTMQEQAQRTSQRGGNKLFVLLAAERMNRTVANALLKTLEEPTEDTWFILCADHLSTILPTVLSRCQIFHLQPRLFPHWQHHNLLMIGDEQEQDFLAQLVNDLLQFYRQQLTASDLASKWPVDDLAALVHKLYLIYGQIQSMYFIKEPVTGLASEHLNHLKMLLEPNQASQKLQQISAIQRNLSHNIHMNSALVLEDLLQF